MMSSKPIQQIFDVFLNKILENDNKISTEVIENLFSLFGSDFIESLQLIDDKCIHLLKSGSNREIFEVEIKGNRSKTTPDRYYCLVEPNFCSCDAFRRGLLNESILFCKHLIASKLSVPLNSLRIVDKTDKEMDRLWTKHILN